MQNAIRLCARLVDMPPSELHTDSYLEEAKVVAGKLNGVQLTVIRGDELLAKGFGGLWGVGKVRLRRESANSIPTTTTIHDPT